MHFNPLELAVLEAMCARAGADAPALDRQIHSATIQRRRNSGAGFFTSVVTDHADTPMTAKTLSGVAADIDGLRNPMVFVLFARDGFIDTLEGASVEEDTSSIDFSSAGFAIRQ